MTWSISLLSLVPVLINCVSSETFYIVTSSKSHCPLEFIGEPCLTLEQYASHYRQGSSNVTLMMESGAHFLQSTELRFGQYSKRINSFIMKAEHPGAKIIYAPSPREYFYNSIYYAQYIQINGITFIGNFVYIVVSNAQEVVINNCSFQGVSFGIIEVTNAVFSRCTFADYRGMTITFYGRGGALSILDSVAVKIVQSNFTNNEIALYGHTYYSSRTQLLHIQKSIFSNNTSEFEGGAVHFAGYHNHASISVNQSIFINNTASRSGGSIYLDVEHLEFSIAESSFIQNSADSCGVLKFLTYYSTSITQITDTTFDSNKALRASDTGGGALCIMNTSAVISNCTFFGNAAVGFGGAFVSHSSMVVINRTIFHSNMAGHDGGALISYAHPSYYISHHLSKHFHTQPSWR